jgi:3-hydroxybutyryl-CoA dehydrogenase
MSEHQAITIDNVRTIAVLGSGTMGHGIAQVAAMAGHAVALYDIDDDLLSAAAARVKKNLDKGVDRGKVDASVRDGALERLRTSSDLADCVREADVVVEAVPEKLELKRTLFAQVAEAAPDHILFASNTSSLSIADIAAELPRPQNVVGMHFFNPVHIMKLVEVIHHAGTSAEALGCAVALAEKFGKTAITVSDAPGFASSRLGIILGLEAMRMVEQGVASPADIDTAMRLGYGHPMGPLELTDLVGLDVRMHIADYLTTQLGEHFRPPEILRTKVADGKLGKKSGAGFYDWKDGKKVVS